MRYISLTILCDFQIFRLRAFKSLHVCFKKKNQPLGRVSSYRKEKFLRWFVDRENSGIQEEETYWKCGQETISAKIDLPVVENDL